MNRERDTERKGTTRKRMLMCGCELVGGCDDAKKKVMKIFFARLGEQAKEKKRMNIKETSSF